MSIPSLAVLACPSTIVVKDCSPIPCSPTVSDVAYGSAASVLAFS
jgi:hypothetical protein